MIDLSLMMIVEKFGGAFLGILAGSAVIRMFYEILNYVSGDFGWQCSDKNVL